MQVDTGRELVRVTWGMMRSAIRATYDSVNAALDEIGLPGQVTVFELMCKNVKYLRSFSILICQ